MWYGIHSIHFFIFHQTNVQFEALTANGHTCFPFTYQGVTYSAGTCADVDAYGQYWCAITNVPNGVYTGMAGQVNWDFCVVKQGKKKFVILRWEIKVKNSAFYISFGHVNVHLSAVFYYDVGKFVEPFVVVIQ